MSHTITTDWNQTHRDFRAVFADIEQRRTKLWSGPNFMTPDVLACWQYGAFRVEVSTGLFPALGQRPRVENRLFGMTFRSPLDCSCGEAIRELSELVGSGEQIPTLEEVRARYDQLVAEALAVARSCSHD